MRRREFMAVLGGTAAWPLAVRAQQSERMRRIGVLNPDTPNYAYSAPSKLIERFRSREPQSAVGVDQNYIRSTRSERAAASSSALTTRSQRSRPSDQNALTISIFPTTIRTRC